MPPIPAALKPKPKANVSKSPSSTKKIDITTDDFRTIFSAPELCDLTEDGTVATHITIPLSLANRILKIEGEWHGYKKECGILSRNIATQKSAIDSLTGQNEALMKIKGALEENVEKLSESNKSLADLAKKSVEAYESERDARLKDREEYKERFESVTKTIEEIQSKNSAESQLSKKNEELLALLQTRTDELIAEKKKTAEQSAKVVVLTESYNQLKEEFTKTVEKFGAVLTNVEHQKELLDASQDLAKKQELVNSQLELRAQLLEQKLETASIMANNFKMGLFAQWDEIKRYRFVVECLRKRLLHYNCSIVPKEEVAQICEKDLPIESVFTDKNSQHQQSGKTKTDFEGNIKEENENKNEN